jgi:hypothetical protein
MMENKRAQVTIFIIIAIVIVGGVVLVYSLKGGFEKSLSKDLEPVYEYYLSCLEEFATQGIALLGEQGGYIETPDFEPGSNYKPFSSHLDFFGQGVPYWMYVSGNNLFREQVPTKRSMEIELARYVGQRAGECDFTDFELAGYDVYSEEGIGSVKITDYEVSLELDSHLAIYFGEQSAVVDTHDIVIGSKLGKFYDLALNVYNFEKSQTFLEKYALDVLRLYAPVTGTEISCSPKVFIEENIKQGIVDGLVANMASLKLDGDYYDLSSKERSYFVTDPGFEIDENLNFMYLSSWPTRVEIEGDLVVEPVGIQEGLGLLGFCYVPYHLVYDIDFPVMVQFFDDEELFQFPVSVIISRNQERTGFPSQSGESVESPVCEYKTQGVEIFTYDRKLNPVPSRISFKCLDSSCEIGFTEIVGGDAYLDGKVPGCVNGFLIARSEGYVDSKYMISSNSESLADIILDKKYTVALDLGSVESALVRFDSDKHSVTAVYPEIDEVELIEEYYNISVLIYEDSELSFPGSSQRKCVEVSESGLLGYLGQTTEKCFDIEIPETVVSFAVVGGGVTREYITEGMLEEFDKIRIEASSFGTPQNLDDIQLNMILAEEEPVYLSFE